MNEAELDQLLYEMKERMTYLQGQIEIGTSLQALPYIAKKAELNRWIDRISKVRGQDEEEG